jgi:acyltransferase-like protein
MAVELRNRLNRALGGAVTLGNTAAFDFPTIDKLVDHIGKSLKGAAAVVQPTAAPARNEEETHKSSYKGYVSDERLKVKGQAVFHAIRILEPILKIKAINRSTQEWGNSRSAWLSGPVREFGWTNSMSFAGPESELRALPNAIVFANHPLGVRDGYVLATFMEKMFPKYLITGANWNRLPSSFDEVYVPIEPNESLRHRGANASALQRMLQGVADEGKSLCIFPGGRIAQFRFRTMTIEEEPWNPMFLRIAQEAGVPLVPVFIHGRLGSLSHAAGIVSIDAKRLLNVREALSKRLAHVEFTVGRPIWPVQLVGDEAAQLRFLREQLFLLQRLRLGRRNAEA